ncbi:MAG: hypothetical protein AAFR90_02665 [Pseudomonadota bacterium]
MIDLIGSSEIQTAGADQGKRYQRLCSDKQPVDATYTSLEKYNLFKSNYINNL